MLATITPKTSAGIFTALLFIGATSTYAQESSSFQKDFEKLYDASCVSCHSTSDLTPLNLKTLSRDLGNGRTFQTWIRIYDRVTAGEMPPRDGPRASDEIVGNAMRKDSGYRLDAGWIQGKSACCVDAEWKLKENIGTEAGSGCSG